MVSLSSLLVLVCVLIPLTTAVIQCPMAYGYYANPYSKYMYVQCLYFVPYVYSCPGGTIWYQYEQRCGYDVYAPDPPAITVATTTKPTTIATTTTTTTLATTTTTRPTTVATTTTTTRPTTVITTTITTTTTKPTTVATTTTTTRPTTVITTTITTTTTKPTTVATTTTTTRPTTVITTTTTTMTTKPTTVATTTTTTRPTTVMTTTTSTTTATPTTARTTMASTTKSTTTQTTSKLITILTSTTPSQETIHRCLKGNPCLNGGSCQPAGKDDFFCLCAKNYYGTRCETVGEGTDLSLLESIVNGNNNNYEHTVENVLNRNNWTDILAVVDVTGSMQPCAAAIYQWMQLANDRNENIRYYVFFNDGDNKPNSAKVIGSTGGIYGVTANDSNKVLATMQTAMKNGDGGDIPENDIEAILRGIELCPHCKNVVHIADNAATPRDLKLLSSVTRPVKVLTCRVDHDGINPALLNIADKTGGSLHTIDEDVLRLANVPIGGKITIGRRTYQRTTTGFILV